jgi:hypothetical protein
LEAVRPTLREGGVFATLWAGEGLVDACPQGKAVDALLAVVVTAREHLWLCVVLMTDGTRDLLLQLLHTFLNIVFALGHD